MIGKGLHLRSLTKSYGKVAALGGLDLDVAPGEIVAVTGPSGAGKTTTCRLVSGIESPDEGEIRLGAEATQDWPPQRRRVAYMFESFALYPRFTVFENIAFPLRSPVRRGDRDEREIGRRVRELLELVEMRELEDRLPSELSGGQKQRAALCRALVQDPAAYLLDEPISHLDAKLRHKLRGEIRQRLKRTGAPTLWCTPDGLEALSVADRVAVLIDGTLEQIDAPERVFLAPASAKVARLIGDPPTNLLAGTLVREGGDVAFRRDGLSVVLPDRVRRRLEAGSSSTDLLLGIRPTEVAVAHAAEGSVGALAEVYTYEPFGKYGVATVRLAGELVKSKSFEPTAFQPGDPVRVTFKDASFLLFDGSTGREIRPREGG